MGYGYDPFLSERSLKPPVFHTSTFVFKSAQDGKEFFELAYGLREKRPNEEPGLIYSRINNPDLEMLEDRLTIWDEAEASLVFASGMAAISTTFGLMFGRERSSCIPIRSTAERISCSRRYCRNSALRRSGLPPRAGSRLWRPRPNRPRRSAPSPSSISKRRPIRPMASSIWRRRARSPTRCAIADRRSSSTTRCSVRFIRPRSPTARIW